MPATFCMDTFLTAYATSIALSTPRAVVSFVVGHPLDLIKTNKQAYPHRSIPYIVKNFYKYHHTNAHPISSFIQNTYKGSLPNFLRAAWKTLYREPLRGTFFWLYGLPSIQTLFPSDDARTIVTGLSMGTVDAFLMSPLERWKVWAMSNPNHKQTLDHFLEAKHHSHSHVKHFYRGTTVALLRGSFSWICYLLFELHIRKSIIARHNRIYPEEFQTPSPKDTRNLFLSEKLSIGVLSGMVNCAFVLPIETLKTQVQMYSASTETKSISSTLFQAIKTIYSRSGIFGFYPAFTIRMTQYGIVGLFTADLIQRVDRTFNRISSS